MGPKASENAAKPTPLAPPKTAKPKLDGSKTPNATLKPPTTNQHRRTTSLPEKPPELRVAEPASNQGKKTPHTILEKHMKIPWSENFREGFGIDALSGEFMAQCALRSSKMVESSIPGKSRISVERLQWKEVKDLQDGFEMEVGGTVNVLCPIGANVRMKEVLSQNNSTSTILVQYKVEADFTADFIPENVQLKKGLDKLSDNDFRNQYGDYYIAGYQKAYSCRMIVVCKINEQTITESLEQEAVALVGRYFKGGIQILDIEKQTTSFSLLSVIVDAEGCSPDPTNVFSVAVADAPKTLSKLLKNAPGVPRIAYLYHYSCLNSCSLSRRVNVPKHMFERARAMRALYAYLQACLLHPALKEFHADRRDFLAVLQRFEEQRKSMIKDENKQEINGLQRDLNSKKDKADALIRRYNFIRIVLNMDKHIISYPPSLVNGLQFYRWDCGKTGDATKLKSKLEAYNLVCFEPSYRAFELEWQSPVTEGSSILPRLLGGTSPRENMIFHTQSSNDVLPPLPPPSSKSHKLSKARPGEQQPETEDPGAFTFCLTNHKPVYILGWSLSCYWPVGKPEPTIEVDHPTNHIFSDRLSISIDNSRSTQWHCKVTFVIKSAYNFPDLLM